MKIENILKEITPELRKREIEKINKTKLSKNLQNWVDEYENIGGKRNKFIWKWLYVVNEDWIYLPIQMKYHSSLVEIKTLCNMFIVLLDDISIEKGKKGLLIKLLEIPLEEKHLKIIKLTREEQRYLKFTQKLWNYICKIVKQYPHYNELKSIYNFDIYQFLNTIRYTNLIYENPNLINTTEYWLYLSYKMQIVVDFDLDLMCCKDANFKNLGIERQIVLCMQEISRIDNWLITWKREIAENDFSSLVIAYSLESNIVNFKDFKNIDKMVKKIDSFSVESYLFRKEWLTRYEKLSKLSKKSKLINTEEILEKAKFLVFMHLVNQDYI